MLQTLFIQNYALIEKLSINFDNDFSVITGETGAGKSILLGALSMVLGNRTDQSVLFNKEKKCVIEAEFNLSEYNLKPFFEENDIDYYDSTIIRREIAPQGKSRAFINDSPVNLGTLKTLGSELIDIHSQHQNLELNTQKFQIEFVDLMANNAKLVNEYNISYRKLTNLNNTISDLENQNKTLTEKYDYIKYQYEELHKANLKENELENLELEQQKLTDSELIAEKISAILQRFSREEYSVSEELTQTKSDLEKISKYFKNGKQLSERINASIIEIEDIIQEVTEISETVEHNPEKLEEINQRMSLIYSLLKKHNKTNIEELIQIKNKLEQEITEVDSFDEQISTLKKEKEKLYKQTLELATKLHTKRNEIAKSESPKITSQIKKLGIQNATFLVSVNKLDKLNSHGISEVNFKFSSNTLVEPKEISKTASGGELSRIMLIIKSLIANKKSLPTLIFDEIDTGVSGEIATKMGKIMLDMGKAMQILCITHLPQVAAMGKHHYFVYKQQSENSKEITKIKTLTEQERITKIAEMLSGEKPSEAAISNAKELLQISIL